MALFSLAHEAVIRRTLGYPPLADLWDSGAACLFGGGENDSLELFRRNPESGFRRAGTEGAARLRVYDELMAHARFVAAADVAGYLAATPDIIRSRRAPVGRGHSATVIADLRAVAFLKEKEAAGCIEAGQHPRARVLLTQVRKLSRRLPADKTSQLIRANESILWGRLLQLMWLPHRSIAYFTLAEKRLQRSGLGLPPGFELLRIRSAVDLAPMEVAQRIGAVWGAECRPSTTNILGGVCEHYGHYLLARCSLAVRAWDNAMRQFGAAESHLEASKHVSRDPIRLSFTTLGRGRAKVGVGSSNTSGTTFQDGLNLLQSARSGFRDLEFAPGEYLAHWYFMEAVADQDSLAGGGRLENAREAHRLAQRTHVARFQLEAGLAYAAALNDEGRKNAAYSIVDGLKRTSDPIARELAYGPLSDTLRILDEQTRDATDNAIEPTAQWGGSAYAVAEAEFVNRVVAASAPTLVSVYGPPGSGRRILLNRIASARGQHGDVEVLTYSDQMPLDQSMTGVVAAAKSGGPFVLHDLDQWPIELQRRVLRVVVQSAEVTRRCYITLTQPLPETNVGSLLPRQIGTALANGSWPIERSTEEWRRDAALLARGFLAGELHALGEQLADVKRLILSGAACRWIRESYDHVSDLYRAMRFLAPRLRLRRDTVELPGGRHRLAVETMVRHLRPQQNAQPARLTSRRPSAPDGSPKVGREILTADKATVAELVKKTNGVFARITQWCDVPRPTLIYNWKRNQRMDWWHDAVAQLRGGARS